MISRPIVVDESITRSLTGAILDISRVTVARVQLCLKQELIGMGLKGVKDTSVERQTERSTEIGIFSQTASGRQRKRNEMGEGFKGMNVGSRGWKESVCR